MLRVNKSRASKGRSPYARTRSSVAIATSATQSQVVRTPMQPEPPVVVPIRTLSATSTSSVAGIASTAGLSSLTAQQTNPEAIPVSVASVIDTVASQQSTTQSAPTGTSNYDIEKPMSFHSVVSPLGAHVPQAMKDKIWNNEYVQLSKLLIKEPTSEVQHQVIIQEGSFQIKPKHKEEKIQSISQWTDAF